jgi:hypothetical protein
MRLAKSFTIDRDLSAFVDETKGERSASDRVNELLRLAMMHERNDRLEAEAADFFAGAAESRNNRTETESFQKGAIRSFSRD